MVELESEAKGGDGMNNILYQTTIVERKDSVDGEMPTILYVTEESNCFAVWINGYDGKELLRYFPYSTRYEAINFTVDHRFCTESELRDMALVVREEVLLT
jgi:hypothetical protein